MPFEKELPEWNALGIAPTTEAKTNGWGPNQHPPADWFNWIQNKTYEALLELQQKAGEVKTVNDQAPDVNGNVNVDTSNLATKTELATHSGDTTLHITQAERDKWNTVTKTTPVNVLANRGAQVVTATHDSIGKVVLVEGATNVNLVPLFDSGLWVVINNNWSVISPSIVSSNATDSYSQYLILVSVKPNTIYTLSAIHNGFLHVYTEDGLTDIAKSLQGDSVTFTTPAGSTKISIYLTNSTLGAGTYTFENVTLNEGTVALPFVANVKGVTNPTVIVKGENLVKRFTHWTRHANTVLNADGSITLTASGANQESSYEMDCVGSQAYTLSATINGTEKYTVKQYDENGTDLGNALTEAVGTFTTHANAKKLKVIGTNGSATSGTFTFTKPMLNLGVTALPFVENNDSSITLLTTLHEGEQVYLDENQQPRVLRKKKERVFDDSLTYAAYSDYSGYKIVKVSSRPLNMSINMQNPSEKIVKYNGKILTVNDTVFAHTLADMIYTDSLDHYISIADTDSGWGETYTPTADEIKAYFLGWRMYNNDGATYPDYNGTGNKSWAKIYCGIGTASTLGSLAGKVVESSYVNVLPTVINDMGYTPYRLIYDLATPQPEAVDSIGSIALHQGDNQVEVSEGHIVRERVRPFVYADWSCVINSIYAGEEASKLNHKLGTLLHFYKNEQPFNGYTISTSSAFGNQRYFISKENFDPTATYEVSYIPLEPYKVSTQTQPITIEYQSNLGSVVDQLVADVTDDELRLSVIERDMVRKGEGVQWIKATLLNGWSGYLYYAKNNLGLVMLRYVLTAGTSTLNTLVVRLPKEYCPIESSVSITTGNNDTGAHGIGLTSSSFIEGIVVTQNPNFTTGQTIVGQGIYYAG